MALPQSNTDIDFYAMESIRLFRFQPSWIMINKRNRKIDKKRDSWASRGGGQNQVYGIEWL